MKKKKLFLYEYLQNSNNSLFRSVSVNLLQIIILLIFLICNFFFSSLILYIFISTVIFFVARFFLFIFLFSILFFQLCYNNLINLIYSYCRDRFQSNKLWDFKKVATKIFRNLSLKICFISQYLNFFSIDFAKCIRNLAKRIVDHSLWYLDFDWWKFKQTPNDENIFHVT